MSLTKPYKETLYERLKTVEEIVAYLEACYEEGDNALICLAVNDVIKANKASVEGTMIKINEEKEIVEVKEVVEVLAYNLAVGETFNGDIGHHKNEGPYLRTFSGLVSLSNPAHTWAIEGFSPRIRNFRPVDIEITVKPRPE
jgi:hypothetical protein